MVVWIARRGSIEKREREHTDMSWRALLMAASCWTCLMRVALGSEEGLREEFRESIIVVMENGSWENVFSRSRRFLVFKGVLCDCS